MNQTFSNNALPTPRSTLTARIKDCNIDNDSRLRNGADITQKHVLNQKFRKCGANNGTDCEDDKNSTENRMRRGNDFGLRKCDTVSEVSTLDLHLTLRSPLRAPPESEFV